MSRFQLKITHHTKNQKDLKLNEKNQSIDTAIKVIQMPELPAKILKQ